VTRTTLVRLCCLHLHRQPWRIRRAEAWVEGRLAAEQLLIVAATLDAANELAREVAKGGAPRLRRRSFALAALQRYNPGGPGA
jgi:hypothetical protein